MKSFECDVCEIAFGAVSRCPNCRPGDASAQKVFTFKCLVCNKLFRDQSEARCDRCFIPGQKELVEPIKETLANSKPKQLESTKENRPVAPHEPATRKPAKKKQRSNPPSTEDIDAEFELLRDWDFQPIPARKPNEKHLLEESRYLTYFDRLGMDVTKKYKISRLAETITEAYNQKVAPLRTLRTPQTRDKKQWIRLLYAAKKLIDHVAYINSQ
jgi:hypothetical protein